MTCKDCKYFKAEIGVRGAVKGSCLIKNTSSYKATRYGRRQACQLFRKGKVRNDMTREEELDWLCRLRSEIYVYMPKEWLIPMNNALDMAIKALEQEPKIGHWIWCVGSHKCSNCEEYTCFSHKELLRYCPNCGCRMESEG